MTMTIGYRVDDPDDPTYEPEYLCVDCGQEALDGDEYYEGMRLTQITNPDEVPAGPSGLGYACDSPSCDERLPVVDR